MDNYTYNGDYGLWYGLLGLFWNLKKIYFNKEHNGFVLHSASIREQDNTVDISDTITLTAALLLPASTTALSEVCQQIRTKCSSAQDHCPQTLPRVIKWWCIMYHASFKHNSAQRNILWSTRFTISHKRNIPQNYCTWKHHR